MVSSYVVPSTLLQAWRLRLSEWSIDGSLSAAAQAALRLPGKPKALQELISEWAAGDFKALPPIEVLAGSVMPGTAGAYAISTGTIYLNGDWLRLASEEQGIAVLSEELGHHLDGWLNTEETPGDEGEHFSLLLRQEALSPERLAALRAEDDHTTLWIDGAWIAVEQATISTSEPPDASSLAYVNISGFETNVIEGNRDVPITFIRSGSLTEDVLITYGIVGDTATDGADFVA